MTDPDTGKRTRNRPWKADNVMAATFRASTGYTEEATFWRDLENHRKGEDKHWFCTCPVCSEDEYVQAGVCSGIFKTTNARLTAGHKPCRCVKMPKWTQAQREYQLRKAFAECSELWTFAGWPEGGYTGNRGKLVAECSEHGKWHPTVDNVLRSRSGCPGCSKTGYDSSKPGAVYVIRVGGISEFTGYGISNNVEERLCNHRKKLLDAGMYINEVEVFYTSGVAAVSIEKAIKSTFPCFAQKVDGFKTEATFCHSFDDVLKLVDEVLKHER